jgi:hypothetical protein
MEETKATRLHLFKHPNDIDRGMLCHRLGLEGEGLVVGEVPYESIAYCF